MPQNKPMKIQWVTIDGRNTPFVLPQIWDEQKQDWVITSGVNPLPTKDDLLLQKMENLNTKVDGILDGSTPVPTQVTGSLIRDGVALPLSLSTSTSTRTSPVIENPMGRGVIIYWDVVNFTSNPEVQIGMRIQVRGVDPANGRGFTFSTRADTIDRRKRTAYVFGATSNYGGDYINIDNLYPFKMPKYFNVEVINNGHEAEYSVGYSFI